MVPHAAEGSSLRAYSGGHEGRLSDFRLKSLQGKGENPMILKLLAAMHHNRCSQHSFISRSTMLSGKLLAVGLGPHNLP